MKEGLLNTLKKMLPLDGDPTVTDKIRRDWNAYLLHLEKKGRKGKPELDTGGAGYKEFDDYVKANPTTSLSRAALPVIRKELLNYRQSVLDMNKKQRVLAEGVTEENFMRKLVDNEKTKDPDYPGMNLTMVSFPESYLTTFQNGKNMGTVNKGFSVIKK